MRYCLISIKKINAIGGFCLFISFEIQCCKFMSSFVCTILFERLWVQFFNKYLCWPTTLFQFKILAHCVFEFDTPALNLPRNTLSTKGSACEFYKPATGKPFKRLELMSTEHKKETSFSAEENMVKTN